MHDLPRQKLVEIVTHRQAVTAQAGRDVLNDARLCEALLRDLCGEHKREIFILVAALKERVAVDLLASQDGVPREVLLTRLTRRLQDNLALTDEAARWAVESWALALGLKLPQPAVPAPPSTPVPVAAKAAPTPKPPAPIASKVPYVFTCAWKVEVLGRPSGDDQAEWKKIGETPDRVTVPAGYEGGLRPQGVGGDALAIWVSELHDPSAIQWLDLGIQPVADEGLESLWVFTGLTRLDISNADKITDEGLAHLGKLSKLTRLTIRSGKGITVRGMAHLKTLIDLIDLDLSETGVTDAGLEHLKPLVRLSSLNLSWTPIAGEGLMHLQGLIGLTSLNLERTKITDAGLVHLRGLTSLTSLDLYGTSITDAGLVHLRGLTGLTDLRIEPAKITDAGLVHLRGLTGLTRLNLDKTNITDAGLVHLRGLTNLVDLEICGCYGVTRAGIAALQRPGLTIIAL